MPEVCFIEVNRMGSSVHFGPFPHPDDAVAFIKRYLPNGGAIYRMFDPTDSVGPDGLLKQEVWA